MKLPKQLIEPLCNVRINTGKLDTLSQIIVNERDTKVSV